MTYSVWPINVNKKFFAYTRNPVDNFRETEFFSGRKVRFLANTRFTKLIKCSLSVNSTELVSFWNWFENTLGGCAGIFYCPELKRNSNDTAYFRFSKTPEEGNGQKNRIIEFEIEEVY